MKIQRVISLLVVFTVFFSFFTGIVSAKTDNNDIPEVDGVYNDPGHPGVKVHVFVHKEKPSQPGGTSLSCNLSDPNSSATDISTGWKLPLNWTYNLNSSSVPASVGSTN